MSSSGDKEEGLNLFDLSPPDEKQRKVDSPAVLVIQGLYLTLMAIPYILWAVIRYFFFTEVKNISGQTVLITGAGKGLGRGLALGFANEGCKVACVDIDMASNEETVAQVNRLHEGSAKAYKANVAKSEDIKAMAEEVERDFGYVDILVNNAGLIAGGPILDGEDYQIEALLKVNFLSHFYMVRKFLPDMLERNNGHIVAISSASSLTAVRNASGYVTTKWAINGFMDCLYEELRVIPNNQIRTTTVCPYFINTSALYTKHWNLRIPELSIENTVKTTINAIKRNERVLTIPKHLYWMLIIQKLLPDNLVELTKNIFFVKIRKIDDELKRNTPAVKIMQDTLLRPKTN